MTVNTEIADEDDPEITDIGKGRDISLLNINKSFDNGDIVACENINIDVSKDEFVVLVGPSGCGKSTTLRCIAGLETPDEGRIMIGDEDVTDKKPKDRGIAFVFQSIALFPHMNVEDNMRFGLDMNTEYSREEKRARIEEAAEVLGISELLERNISALSGGQRQRVSLGRAMVMEPSVFLLDEPFSALDANLRDKMRTEIKKLQRTLNTAMVFVTHDQEEAMTLGDKIVVMNDGRIQQVGSAHEIYNQPKNRFVAEFIGSPSTNFFSGELKNNKLLIDNLLEIDLDEESIERVESWSGSRVIVGVRSENWFLDGDGSIDATTEVVEPQGSRDILHLEANGETFQATVPQGEVTEGSRIRLELGMDDIWLFADSGERIL